LIAAAFKDISIFFNITIPYKMLCTSLDILYLPRWSTTTNFANHIGLVLATLAKNSRERGWVHSGGGFGRMFRIAWYSAKQPGAQPSGTFSCQQAAN